MLTGAANAGQQVMDQMMASVRPMAPWLKQDFWDGKGAEMDADERVELIIPSYAAHLTRPELAQLIVFYESPVGKKLIAEQPEMLAESMVAGQAALRTRRSW